MRNVAAAMSGAHNGMKNLHGWTRAQMHNSVVDAHVEWRRL
jgi:hypothetical protein